MLDGKACGYFARLSLALRELGLGSLYVKERISRKCRKSPRP
ncbi:MAG: hypothetical protein ACLRPT_04840 [Akkermansia muciniphila]